MGYGKRDGKCDEVLWDRCHVVGSCPSGRGRLQAQNDGLRVGTARQTVNIVTE